MFYLNIYILFISDFFDTIHCALTIAQNAFKTSSQEQLLMTIQYTDALVSVTRYYTGFWNFFATCAKNNLPYSLAYTLYYEYQYFSLEQWSSALISLQIAIKSLFLTSTLLQKNQFVIFFPESTRLTVCEIDIKS
jgi:hypothetical protein